MYDNAPNKTHLCDRVNALMGGLGVGTTPHAPKDIKSSRRDTDGNETSLHPETSVSSAVK